MKNMTQMTMTKLVLCGLKRLNVLKILVFILITTAIVAYQPPKKSVLDHMAYWNRLRKFSTLINLHNLTSYFEQDDITVFVPTTKAYNKFMSEANKFGYNLANPETIKSFLLYHVGKGVIRTDDMFNKTSSKTIDTKYNRFLFFNTFLNGDTRVFTINGARIISADISARNGYVHVIDRFLTPLQSSKPVAQFLETPDLPNLAFTSISMASIVDPVLKADTSNNTKRFTVFAPNDSYIVTMPKYGQDRLFSASSWDLLKSVFWAHVIENQVLFIPSVGELTDVQAKAGTVRFYRSGSEVHISNNKVRARVVEPNIPVANGVIHVIDDLLFYVYRNLKQKIEVIPNLGFIRSALNKVLPELLAKLENSSSTITMFLPTDDAFAKLPDDRQLLLNTNGSKLTQLLKDHMVLYKDRDIDSLLDGETLFTTDSKVLTIHRRNGDVYVEGGIIRGKITVPDIGCTNGIIHLISNVMFQRDFTIWDAVQGNSQLSTMADFINLNYSNIQATLSSTNHGPLTVLLISDSAFQSLPTETVSDLQMNPGKLTSAIQGSIIHGAMLSSGQVQEEIEISTLSGHSMKLYNSQTGLYVIGSYIRANIIIQDIWCSNGILHITDNILHLPTRTVKDEIELRPYLSVMTGVIPAFQDISERLSQRNEVYTMFVPSDQAFTYMPTYRSQVLRDPELLKSIVASHIVRGSDHLLEELGNYTRYTSEGGGNIFVVKKDNKVYVTANNAKASVISSNIKCTNGMLHIVDTMLLFPYETVAETMESRPELRPFYELIQQVDEFFSWATALDVEQTVFIPSAQFLSNLPDNHKTALASEPGLIQKIFYGHFLPAMTLDENYLNKSFAKSRVFLTDSRFNLTFTLTDNHHSSSREWVTVDIGYSNMKQTFDLALDGIACSNGVIYVIEGFLNYPLNNILEELRITPNISIAVEKLLDIIPNNSSIDFTSKNTVFTIFVPADRAFNFLTLNDIFYINDNLTYTERIEITGRHVIPGQIVTYEEIINGEFNYYLQNHNLSAISRTDGLYLKWNEIETKIITENILTSNGIIHIVDRFLLSTPYQTTTVPSTSKTSIGRVSLANCLNISHRTLLYALTLVLLTHLFVLR